MPHMISDVPQKLRVLMSQAANVFLAIVMLYIVQYIFNSEFTCSCKPSIHPLGIIYILIIPLILFFILNIFKETRSKTCAKVCCGFFPHIFQLLGIYLFWGGFILLDGDIYLCIKTKWNATLLEIPCRTNLTFQEKMIITKFKNCSRVYGYLCITLGFLGWWLASHMSSAGIDYDCRNICTSKPYYRRRYEELLSEETDKHLEKKLKEIAKEKAERICSKHVKVIEKSEYSVTEEADSQNENADVDNTWFEISKSDLYKSEISLSRDSNQPVEEILLRID